MGKVGPNHWSSNQVIFRTILVTHEDKTRNHTDTMRAQTCVILVNLVSGRMLKYQASVLGMLGIDKVVLDV